jgi:hypothetical protein
MKQLDHASAAGIGGVCVDRFGHRRLPRHGRRLRLQPAEVQPRHAGLAPARFLDQAVRVFGGAGTRLLAGHHHQRRAARPDRRRNRQRSLVAANDDGKFDGPITMRTALAESKNVASVRILRAITVPYAHGYLASSASTWPSIRRT